MKLKAIIGIMLRVVKMTDKPIIVQNLITLDPSEPDNRDRLVPNDEYSVGKEMTKKQVLKFIEKLPEPNYFVRWDYRSPQYKMLEIYLPGEE